MKEGGKKLQNKIIGGMYTHVKMKAVALQEHGTYLVDIAMAANKMYPKQFVQFHHFEKRGHLFLFPVLGLAAWYSRWKRK